MSNIHGPLTLSSTGNSSFTGFGFRPTELEFYIGGKNGNASAVQFSIGSVDETGYVGAKYFVDGLAAKDSSSKCILHYENVSGVLTKKLEATFVSFDADGFTINVTAFDTAYPVFVRARNS